MIAVTCSFAFRSSLIVEIPYFNRKGIPAVEESQPETTAWYPARPPMAEGLRLFEIAGLLVPRLRLEKNVEADKKDNPNNRDSNENNQRRSNPTQRRLGADAVKD